MLTHETTVRVRYADTDQMGYVYHARYLEYLEVGRTDLVRHIGLPYAEVEEMGILMPVIDLSIRYKQPAYYDNVLRIKTTVPSMPQASFPFEYEVYNEQDQLILTAELRLAFIDKARKRPVRVPDFIREAIVKKLEDEEVSR